MSSAKVAIVHRRLTRADLERKTDLGRHMRLVEGSEAAARFLATYGKKGVKAQYAFRLGGHHR